MANKYKAAIIKVENFTIDIATGEIINPTSEEKLMDGFNMTRQKFSLITLYSKMTNVTCRSLRELNSYAWEISDLHNLGYDFEVYIYK